MSILVLTTSLPDVTLRHLRPDDAPQVFALIQTNRGHLTAHGDYAEQVSASVGDIVAELVSDADRHYRFGVCVADDLVGRVDLLGVAPPRYGLGYWLAASHVGQGIATVAVRRVIEFAFGHCAASDIYAGVSHGNERSASLLRRLEFEAVARFETYTRFHRQLP